MLLLLSACGKPLAGSAQQPLPTALATSYPLPAATTVAEFYPRPYAATITDDTLPTTSAISPPTWMPDAAALAEGYPLPTPVSQPTPAASVVIGLPPLIQGGTCRVGAPVLTYTVVAEYPHDPAAYTQGLVYHATTTFYEGTGDWEHSALREVDLTTGQVRREVLLQTLAPAPPGQRAAFGEGIAVVGERIFQLTWLSRFGLIYDRATFAEVGRFTYPPPGADRPVEGWGMTYDGEHLIMSDGSGTLFLVDPAATERTGVLAIVGQIEVHDSLGVLDELNELEYVNGEILANVYNYGNTACNLIARIDPASGAVRSYIDLSTLRQRLPPAGPEVLNGIAYDAAGDRLFVTGKWWPTLFEIDLPTAHTWIVRLPLALMSRPT